MQQSIIINIFREENNAKTSISISESKSRHIQLAHFNHVRLLPQFINENWALNINKDFELLLIEGHFVQSMRAEIQPYL